MLQTTPKYITLDDAIRIVTKWSGVSELQIEGLTKLPAADVEPVRHGRWVVKGDAQPISNDKIYGCNLCDDKNRRYYKWQLSNYCPNCGARMDEEVTHG